MGKNQILAAFLAAVTALSCISFPAAASDTPEDSDSAITLGFQIQDADNGKNGWYINPDMNNQDEIAVDLIMTGNQNQNQIDFFTAQLYIQYDPAVLNFNFSDGAESKIIASQSRNNINYLTLTASNPKSGVIQLTYTPFSASLQTPNAKVTGGAAFTTLYFTLADANDSLSPSTSLSYQTPANLPNADMMVIRNIPANPVPETRYDLQYASVRILMPGASNPTKTPTNAPTKKPTKNPTDIPVSTPTPEPITPPIQTQTPTRNPTNAPINTPTNTPTPIAINTSSRFRDIAGSWAEESIRRCEAMGLFDSMQSDLFYPNEPINRGDFIAVLWHLYQQPGANVNQTPFTDIQHRSTDIQTAIAWAYANGYINGTTPDTFSPDAYLTRQAAMKVMFNASGAESGVETLFTQIYEQTYQDSYLLADWAKTPVYWGIYNTLIQGNTPTTLNPGGLLSGAQLAVITLRYINRFYDA